MAYFLVGVLIGLLIAATPGKECQHQGRISDIDLTPILAILNKEDS